MSAQARKGPSSPSVSHQGQLTFAGNQTNKQTQVRLILTLGFCLNSAFSKCYHLNLHQCNPLMTSCFYTVLSHCLWNPVFTPHFTPGWLMTLNLTAKAEKNEQRAGGGHSPGGS